MQFGESLFAVLLAVEVRFFVGDVYFSEQSKGKKNSVADRNWVSLFSLPKSNRQEPTKLLSSRLTKPLHGRSRKFNGTDFCSKHPGACFERMERTNPASPTSPNGA